VDNLGRILLARVAPGYMGAGMWTLPGGGLNFGEDPADAVLRELAEETGLSGRVLSLSFVNSHTNGPLVEAGKAYGPWHGIRIVYRVEVTGGHLRDEVDESTDAAAWLTRNEIASLTVSDLVSRSLDFLDTE
jgi:ADP-ribose pyrophosphatase YjhB (NUDIX family)